VMKALWLLRLARPANVLMLGLIHYLLYAYVVQPVSLVADMHACLTPDEWLWMSLACMLVAAGGNVLNEICDQDPDAYNRPEKVIVGEHVSERAAWMLYGALTVMGIGLALWGSVRLGRWQLASVYVLSAGALWFYSKAYKRMLIVGNLVVAFLAFMAVILPSIIEQACTAFRPDAMPWTLFISGYAIFAFLTTLVREVIKDLEDAYGDGLTGCRTLPVVYGANVAKGVAVGITLLIMGLLWPVMNYPEGYDWYWYLMLAVQVPSVGLIWLIIKAQEPKDFNRASLLSKVIMLMGVLSMLVLSM